MRFETIASGSSGNCIYIGSETTHLLVDVGISRKRTAGALKDLDLSLQDIDGILITHEHSDHIGGLSMIAKQTQMPIYATRGTIAAIRRNPAGESIDPERFVPIRADEKQTIKDLTINPMSISHDAAEPVGYRILYGSRKAVVCTDLGCFTDYTVECLKNTDVLLLEANHDINMLQVGPYPYPLKQRILGDRGHLSNLASGKLLSQVLNSHMRAIFLGHLSQENNLPELAYETVRFELLERDCGFLPEDLPIRIAPRKEPSVCIDF